MYLNKLEAEKYTSNTNISGAEQCAGLALEQAGVCEFGEGVATHNQSRIVHIHVVTKSLLDSFTTILRCNFQVLLQNVCTQCASLVDGLFIALLPIILESTTIFICTIFAVNCWVERPMHSSHTFAMSHTIS